MHHAMPHPPHLGWCSVHNVQKVAVLVVHDPRVFPGDRRVDAHHGAVGFVREGDRVGLPASEGSPSSADDKPASLHGRDNQGENRNTRDQRQPGAVGTEVDHK